MRRLRLQLAIALGLSLLGSINMNAQTIKDRALDAWQQNIVMISGLTATGDLEHLRTALNSGLDGGLTVNEIKDVLVQMYAYCGFPRSRVGKSGAGMAWRSGGARFHFHRQRDRGAA